MNLHSTFVWMHVLLEMYGHVGVGLARRGRGRQTGAVSLKRGDSRAHEWCPPCDVTHCPMVTSSTCAGNIVLDMCDCCPICVSKDMPQEPGSEANRAGEIMQGPNFDYEAPGPGELGVQTQNQSEACAKITCPKFQMCMLNIQNLPMCRCPTKFLCMKSKRRPVCGEDQITYKSKCFLKMAQCDSGKTIQSYSRGKCPKSEEDNKLKQDRLRLKEERRLEREEKKRVKKEKMEKKRRKKERKIRKEKKRNRQANKQKRWARYSSLFV